VQVIPAEVAVAPGASVKFRARLYDAKANFIREAAADWSLDQLSGAVIPGGEFTASAANKGQAGRVVAEVGGVEGYARVRVIPPLPWNEDFSDYDVGKLPAWWMNAGNKYAVKELEGQKVLAKLADNQFSFIKRARAYAGLTTSSGYTVQCDIRFAVRRRQTGDAGVVAQGYQLTIFPNHDRVELFSWQPETERTVQTAFSARPDTWYRALLRVETLPGGAVRARGKIWPASEAEPAAWTIERTDKPGYGILQGSPGIYGDAAAEIYFDNFKVYANPESARKD
jgi:hypothetical protein